jgi:hypothetical protein
VRGSSFAWAFPSSSESEKEYEKASPFGSMFPSSWECDSEYDWTFWTEISFE